MNLEQADRAKALRDNGMSGRQIAATLGIDYESALHTTSIGYIADLQRRLKEMGHYDGDIDGLFWNKSHAAFLAAIDAAQCPPTLPDGSSSLIISPASMTLRERALDWCLNEADRHGEKRVPDSRVAEYFAGAMRNGTRIGDWLARTELQDKDWSFCAAAQGFAEFQASLPDEDRPPWRAGALEIMRDAIDGRRPGERWLSLQAVLHGGRHPKDAVPKGCLVVYENTQATGRGHVERLIEIDAIGFRSVGANENNRQWVVDRDKIRFTDAARADGSQRLKLLGFVVPA